MYITGNSPDLNLNLNHQVLTAVPNALHMEITYDISMRTVADGCVEDADPLECSSPAHGYVLKATVGNVGEAVQPPPITRTAGGNGSGTASL